MFARLSASRERNHSTWGRKGGEGEEREGKGGSGLQTALDMSPIFIHRWRVIGPVSSVCGLCCCQESIEEERREGRCRDKRLRGREGEKVEGLALGLFAALSFPLSALAHLHLCQLDVPQHVGVCDGERKRESDESWIRPTTYETGGKGTKRNVFNWKSTTNPMTLWSQNMHVHTHTLWYQPSLLTLVNVAHQRTGEISCGAGC